jgi:hypothetical protein
MDEARRRDERWMEQMQNAWRNEQLAQQQLQQDEEQQEQERWRENQALLKRMERLEESANNRSGQEIADYQMQNRGQNNLDPPNSPPSPPSPPPPSPPVLPPPSPPISLPPSPSLQPPQIQFPLPRAGAIYQEPAERHSLGLMTLECPHCHALHFAAEKLSNSTLREPKFGMCCLSGQVDLPPFPVAPRDLRHLFDGTSPYSLEFKTNIRQYNSAFAFTSLGVKVDQSVIARAGSYSF